MATANSEWYADYANRLSTLIIMSQCVLSSIIIHPMFLPGWKLRSQIKNCWKLYTVADVSIIFLFSLLFPIVSSCFPWYSIQWLTCSFFSERCLIRVRQWKECPIEEHAMAPLINPNLLCQASVNKVLKHNDSFCNDYVIFSKLFSGIPVSSCFSHPFCQLSFDRINLEI